MFVIKKRRSADAHCPLLNSYFIKLPCEYCKISKGTYFEEHLHTDASGVTFGSDCLGLSFWTVAFKTMPTLVILQKYQSLSKQSFKHDSAHRSSLNLTPMLSFEPIGFMCSSLTVTTEKAKACSPWTSCLGICFDF